MSILGHILHLDAEHARRLAQELHHQTRQSSELLRPPELPSNPPVIALRQAAQAAIDSTTRRTHILFAVGQQLAENSLTSVGHIEQQEQVNSVNLGGQP
ncbi:hypothetical protein GP475_02940 [Corynebacterium poyangense]|uniref:Uncharacterized protein n=1 Tax=Corynebacterium poyangense TaxID=2684405 RepID=A0A7H0SME2_9CORY|nr:hypothetical protein [Corynebacterium poyangense]QNQ89717.1 hypothetical protein GP475_02940 [Corynebacterium poyangense]